MVDLPNKAQTAGIPAQWDDTISATAGSLITGHEPAILTQDLIVAASQTIPALTPVGFDADERLVPAVRDSVDPADDIAAVGITVVAITTTASTTYKGVPVYRGGCFNPDLLNWPASFNTDAEKFAAFEGAPSPTNIIMRRPRAHSI